MFDICHVQTTRIRQNICPRARHFQNPKIIVRMLFKFRFRRATLLYVISALLQYLGYCTRSSA